MRKKIIKSLLILPVVICIVGFYSPSGYSQTYGFEQQQCGIVQNPNYYFENYRVGSHGYAFRLYHNGILLEADTGAIIGDMALELRFIDDTTGFFISTGGDDAYTAIEKIINNSRILLWTFARLDYDFFIVDKYTVYLVSYPGSHAPWWEIIRLSDINGPKLLKNMYYATDSTVYDTILGYPLCQNLKELDYRFLSPSDTVTFKIKFSADDTLANVDPLMKSGLVVYPNPATDFIKIKDPENGNPYSLSFLDNLGVVKKRIEKLQGDQEVYVGDLPEGVYFLVVESVGQRTVCKVVRM